MIMEIKYYWAPTGKDPKEVDSLVFDYKEGSPIPRIGEKVKLEVALSEDEVVYKSGRVVDVTWVVSGFPMVQIFLSR
jgi:hypothetical protein